MAWWMVQRSCRRISKQQRRSVLLYLDSRCRIILIVVTIILVIVTTVITVLILTIVIIMLFATGSTSSPFPLVVTGSMSCARPHCDSSLLIEFFPVTK